MWIKVTASIVLLILTALLTEDLLSPHCVTDDNTVYQSDEWAHEKSAQNSPTEDCDSHHTINHFGHCAFVLSEETFMVLPALSPLLPIPSYSFSLKLNKPPKIVRPPIS